jgi:hypothetical protein
VVGEYFTVPGEVVLLYGRRGVGGFRVEEAGELGDESFSLEGC